MSDERVDDAILAISMVATFLGLGLLVTGEKLALVPLIVGILGFAYLTIEINPIEHWLTSQDDASTDTEEEALTVLRQRYARGEIDQAEFERRLSNLLETETLKQAEKHHEESLIGERSQ